MITYDIAKYYVEKFDWSVIPVILTADDSGKFQKKPAVPWREYMERKPTDDELHKWFDNGTINGIGLVTGKISRVVVLDEDTPVESMDKTPIYVKTISGGHHYYYRWTEEIRNDVKIEGLPLDIRGDGGFVVLPPSGIGEKVYVLEREAEPMFLNSLPEEIKKKLSRGQQASQITRLWQPVTSVDIPEANEGERNVVATKYAGSLIASMNKKLWSTVGFEAFVKWNEEHCHPPLPISELGIIWNSIASTQIRNHQDEEEVPTGKLQVYKGIESTVAYRELMSLYGSGTGTGFLKLDGYFSFLPEQLYLLSSATHQGKTTLALNIAARVASEGHPVLFASLEQGVFIEPRIRTIMDSPVPNELSILCSDQTVSVNTLIEYVESLSVKPKLLVIDHLHFIRKIKAEATEAIDDMIINIQNMAKRLHIAVFVIAHVRKLNGDRPPELDDLRDSSSLSQVPSVVMLLYRKKSETGDSYLSNDGVLLIAKNRIRGRTGALKFRLEVNGEFNFSPDTVPSSQFTAKMQQIASDYE